ncbi:Conserved oligomeric Golgi complex subunit 7, partial [Tetrabaena socialis]
VLMGDAADEGGAGVDGGAAPGLSAAAEASTTTAEEWEELAAEWLDQAVSGAAAQYAEAIAKIPELGQQGGAQLATDVEYFLNVMGALHVAPPASLLTVQLLAGAAPEEFGELARGAAAEGAADTAALRALAAMRRLDLEAVPAS